MENSIGVISILGYFSFTLVLLLLFFIFIYFSDMASIAQAGLQLPMQPRMTLSVPDFLHSCPNSEITCRHHRGMEFDTGDITLSPSLGVETPQMC